MQFLKCVKFQVILVLSYSLSLFSKDLTQVNSFLYQLQDLDIQAVCQTDFDLVIMDYSSDGSSVGEYSLQQVDSIRNSGKIVLAYLSIGEAEDYRFYWQSAWEISPPAWLDQENPDWPGNYKVRYWQSAWQAIVFEYLQKIINTGFDGVYLDLIDAYESYQHLSSIQSTQEMADFVKAIRDTAHSSKPGFYIIPQNGADLASIHPAYLNSLDGIGQEDIYYGYDGDGIITPASETTFLESQLDLFKNAGKLVLTIDYPFSQSEDVPHYDAATVTKVRDAYQKSRAKGYVPFCAVRNLNHLTINPGHQNTFHVDQNHASANDSNPGTSILPWKTFTYAVDQLLPGDTLLIHPDQYTGDSVAVSGTKDNHITLKGSNRDSVILSGIEIRKDVSYIDVQRLTVANYPNWGITISGGNRYITLSDLHIHNGGDGIVITIGYSGDEPWYGPVSNVMIKNCLLHDFQFSAINGTPGPCDSVTIKNCEIYNAGSLGGGGWGADGIGIEKGSSIIVEDCKVHDNTSDGIDLNSRDHSGSVDGIIVRRNHVYRNHTNGIKCWSGGLIENNAVWGHGFAALSIGAHPGTYQVVNNSVAYNMWSTAYGARDYAATIAYPEPDSSAICSLKFVNNIFAFNSNDAQGGPTGIYMGEGVVLTEEGNNLFWSRNDGELQADFVSGDPWISRQMIHNGIWSSLTGFGQGDTCANPLFMSGWPDVDLQLQHGSPAIDNGRQGGAPSTDLTGTIRPMDYGVDMGAYEYQDSNSVGIKSISGRPASFVLYQNYPNPFNGRTVISVQLSVVSWIRLVVYNVLGQEVSVIVDEKREEGLHHFQVNASGWESGIYFYRLQAGDRISQTGKMVLLK